MSIITDQNKNFLVNKGGIGVKFLIVSFCKQEC